MFTGDAILDVGTAAPAPPSHDLVCFSGGLTLSLQFYIVQIKAASSSMSVFCPLVPFYPRMDDGALYTPEHNCLHIYGRYCELCVMAIPICLLITP